MTNKIITLRENLEKITKATKEINEIMVNVQHKKNGVVYEDLGKDYILHEDEVFRSTYTAKDGKEYFIVVERIS